MFSNFEVAILKIQDGCLLHYFLVGTTGCLVFQNISLDAKIMSLCVLELKIQHFFIFEAAILKFK